ncbi:MAG: hypothetical protein Q7W55_00585 [Pseudohongiella sp.]|nr:hypothetical protein [Pseudohongiella sp.]MDO9520965.1 hypothetical protein [Pseudohongiella sp.]MDP2126884.1 hypothetical protein [Pseudohongiella sp.]
MQDTTRSKLKLAFLLLIAFVPITMATFAYRSAMENGGFGATVNKGNFILPPADITDLAMTDADGNAMFRSFEEIIAEIANDDDYVAQPWLMVYLTGTDCDVSCRDRIHLLRQMHITLGKNQPRVRRYYLNATGEQLPQETAGYFREEYPSMGIAHGSRELILRNFSEQGISLDLENNSYVFFVDPVGNVMMYYEPRHTIEEIKSDLQRLLSLSSLG